MREMTGDQRLRAAKWAAEQRLRLDIAKADRYAKLRDRLIVDSVNDHEMRLLVDNMPYKDASPGLYALIDAVKKGRE